MADNRKRLFALRGLEAHPFHGGYSSLTALEPIRFTVDNRTRLCALRGLGVRPRRCSGLDAVAECPAQSGDRLLPIHAAHGRWIGAFAEFAPDEQGQLGAIGKGSAVGTPNCWSVR